MSTSDPTQSEAVFCDTSVLLNYVLDQGDVGARKLLAESDRLVVISEKVENEFEQVPDRREDIYLDFMQLISRDGESVEDLSITDRDYLMPNDEGFFVELKDEIADGDGVKDRLTRLRERMKIIDRRYGQTREIIHEVCDQNDDLGLLLQLGTIIDNEDDCQVVADAVQWAGDGGSGAFATLDIGDIVSNADAINEIIADYHGEGAQLDIGRASEFVELEG